MKILLVVILSAMAIACPMPQQLSADMSTLDQLLGGGTLTHGTTTWQNFSLVADDGSISPDLSLVSVSTFNNGLDFSSMSEFQLASGLDTISIQVAFDVVDFDRSLSTGGVDLSNGGVDAGSTGVVDLFADFQTLSAGFLGEANAFADPFAGGDQLSDSIRFGQGVNELRAFTSLTLFGDPNSSVSVNSFRVVTAVPEPGSVILLVGAGCLVITRRRRSAN